jgi:capsular exopolysaccharide synthesis family protein
MNQADETGTLRDYLRVLRERRGLILAVTGIAAAAALAYAAVKTPTYTASTTISYEDPTNQAQGLLGQATGPDFSPLQEPNAAAQISTGDQVLEQVSAKTGEPTEEIRGNVEASVDAQSNLVSITASAGDADEAAELANAVATQTRVVTRNAAREFFADAASALSDDPFSRQTRERLKQLGAVADPVEVIRPAEAPSSPSSPKPLRDTIIAAFLGLLAGTGAAFLRHSLDRRLTDAHEVQHELGLPLVGYVRSEALGMAGASANGQPRINEEDLEAFRILRTNVDFLAKDEEMSSVAITSGLPEEGKSTVAAWYAYASAVAGRPTILVECDFRKPVLAERFGLDPNPGLSDYLAGDTSPKDVLRSVSVEGPQAADVLPVIPAGSNAYQPAEMIGSQRFRDFFEQITRAYELVVVDTSPLLPVGDTLQLLPLVDSVLYCVRLNQTTRDQALAGRQAIEHLPEKPTGLVITGLKPGSDDDYYGYYSYSRMPVPVRNA